LIHFGILIGLTWAICLGAFIFFAIVDKIRIAQSIKKHLKIQSTAAIAAVAASNP